MMLQRGKTVTPQWLAQQLQTYEIRPKTMRIGDERAKGHEMEDFKETFRRYIPRSEYESFRKEIEEQWAQGKDGTGERPANGEGCERGAIQSVRSSSDRRDCAEIADSPNAADDSDLAASAEEQNACPEGQPCDAARLRNQCAADCKNAGGFSRIDRIIPEPKSDNLPVGKAESR